MYIVLGIKEGKVIMTEHTNEINALNQMATIQRQDNAFILNKAFPSAYPYFDKACKLHLEFKENNNDFKRTLEVLNELEELEIKQGIYAMRKLLNK